MSATTVVSSNGSYSYGVVNAHRSVVELAEKLANRVMAQIGSKSGLDLTAEDFESLEEVVHEHVSEPGNLNASDRENILKGTVFRSQDFYKGILYDEDWARDWASLNIGKRPWEIVSYLCELFLRAEVLLAIVRCGKYQPQDARGQLVDKKLYAERLEIMIAYRSGPRKQGVSTR